MGQGFILTIALGADRTGKFYDSPIEPDHAVPIDWQELGTANDPVLQTAVLGQSSCRLGINR